MEPLKPNGWKAYETISNDMADTLVDIVEETETNINKVMEKVDKIQDKIKFAAFGKII